MPERLITPYFILSGLINNHYGTNWIHMRCYRCILLWLRRLEIIVFVNSLVFMFFSCSMALMGNVSKETFSCVYKLFEFLNLLNRYLFSLFIFWFSMKNHCISTFFPFYFYPGSQLLHRGRMCPSSKQEKGRVLHWDQRDSFGGSMVVGLILIEENWIRYK